MYPAMLRAENFQRQPGPAQYGTDGVAYGGPIQMGLVENPPLHLQAGIPTLKNLGLPENLESLNGNNIGTMYQPAIQRFSNHTRSYAVDYLPRAGSNLIIKYNTTVSRVKIESNCATGVILPDGSEIKASKEVIISAGSLLSPKILELSGIGQKAVLDRTSIKQLVDLPGVGENLQDHTRIQSTYELKPSILGLDILKYNATRAAIELDLYKRNQTSLYQYAGSAYGFLKWSQALNDSSKLLSLAKQSADLSNTVDRKKLQLLTTANNGVPNIEIIFSDGYTNVKGYPANTTSGYGKQYATIFAGVMHPFARGSIHINSSDPATKPIINPRYLSTPYDVEASIQAAKYSRKIANTAPYTDVWVKEYDPGTAVQTDAQWEAYVRDNVWTFYHPMGTCAMLPRKDGGVVDKELKVYGVEGLRVVDASVIPMIISAHIQTAVYGIAERASEMIARKWL
jgi:choline dehydrogenase-like flavoprotein